MADDPINPAHYAGRACADIGERLTGNGYQILKYVWRKGRKDAEAIEMGKAVWYADSECKLLADLAAYGFPITTAPLVLDLPDPAAFLAERIEGQPTFVRGIAQLLWGGYDLNKMCAIHGVLESERDRYASS